MELSPAIKEAFYRAVNARRGFRRRARNVYYGFLLRSLGKKSWIADGVRIFAPQNVSIGSNTFVNDDVIIQSCEGALVTIGDFVVLSYGVKILTGGLIMESRSFETHHTLDVTISNGVWIGASSIILPGVTLGDGVVVAAGSVVNKSFPANSLVAGVPARLVKQIPPATGMAS